MDSISPPTPSPPPPPQFLTRRAQTCQFLCFTLQLFEGEKNHRSLINLSSLDGFGVIYQKVSKAWYLRGDVYKHSIHIHEILHNLCAVPRRLCAFVFYAVLWSSGELDLFQIHTDTYRRWSVSFNSNNFKFFTTVIEVFARSSMCTTIFQQRFSDFVVPSDSRRLNPNLDGSYSFRTCFGQFAVQAGPLVLQ